MNPIKNSWKWKKEVIFGIENGQVVKVATESCYPPSEDGKVIYVQRKFSYGELEKWFYNEKKANEILKGGI